MTAPKHAPADPVGASRVATDRPFWLATNTSTVIASITPVLLIAGRALVEYIRDGWILVELAYVLALYLFAFRYPFETPFFFETANWGLGLLTVCTTLLLVARAMRPAAAQPALAHVSPRAYTAGLLITAAALRILAFVVLLALTLLSRHLINATGGALLAGSVGLIAGCIVLAALTLVLSPAFTPRPAQSNMPPDGRLFRRFTLLRLRHLIFIAWLTGALYSYTAAGALAAIFAVWRLPLLPLFACYAMGVTGAIGWGGLLALMIAAGYVVGLALLAASWLARREVAPAGATLPEPEDAIESQRAVQPARATAPTAGATRATVRTTRTTPSSPASRATPATSARRKRPANRKRARG